ncbi:hypothetical protein BCR44DRAFT_1498569 [Catenaria anguillulae PL171]|uniref:Aminomethyltransferase n=1 Tax=Catenaria anguillulae PL171 TaxID=765915 RepID=A0A1Y2HUH8_9FUNG|nr:hypothetical protein BCR44DRAFT_1498569 [Catenaria anguillulae PL171]
MASAVSETEPAARRTSLYDFHLAHGGKLVPFAGWSMPLSYPSLTHIQSHMHTRTHASLFDVSHMLQTRWTGRHAIEFMERLVVGDIQGLAPSGAATLSLFTTAAGGILDDTVIQRVGENELYVVSNAGCADKDLAHIHAQLAEFTSAGDKDVRVQVMDGHSLVALQGPTAVSVVEELAGTSLAGLKFMHGAGIKLKGIHTHVTRCGYTGEDGVEISVKHGDAPALAELLVKHKEVELAGLGARDSLRLEAGLCLYGHDMDESVSPVEASLLWTIGARKITFAAAPKPTFLGAEHILSQIGGPITKRRVGLIVAGAPAREGAQVVDLATNQVIGKVTSGVPSPVLKKNIAMAYVKGGFHKSGTEVGVVVRGKTQKATVSKMPFVPQNYYRG